MSREATPYLAELLGTFGFVFLATASIAVNIQTRDSLGLLGVALAHGIGILAFTYAFSHISGAHLNPAITIGLWAAKQLDNSTAAGYIISQLFGGTLAAIFIEGLLGGATQVVPQPVGLDTASAIFIEAILTFLLVLVFFGTVVDRRAHTSHAGLALGLVVTALVLVGLNLTGGVLNPARAFGPAFVANFWSNQLLYWFGPLIGSLTATLVYTQGILKAKS